MTHWKPSEEMLQRELDLCARLGKKWKCTVEMQHKYSVFDAVAHKDNKPQAFVELRIINYAYYDLPDIMISLTKCTAGKNQTEITGLPSLFVVHWKKDDTIGYIDINKTYHGEPDYRVSKKGMNRLNDEAEIEVCRHVRTSQFKILSGI